MYRGTTPTHIFTDLPVSRGEIAALRITYAQNGREVLSVSLGNVDFITDNALSLTLAQVDTLSFSKGRVQIQMRILLVDGTALASDVVSIPVGEILKEDCMV